jgi:hypothetical protein
MKNYFIRDGKMTDLSSVLVVVITFGGILGTLYFQPPFWLGIFFITISVVVGAIGTAAGVAESVGLKPFTTDPLGWRKIKKSESKSVENESTDETRDKGTNPPC